MDRRKKSQFGVTFFEVWPAAVACLLFVCLGLAVVPYPGIQNDEALFAAPLYTPRAWHAKVHVFQWDIPTMLMSYLGALKSWLYAPWFRIWAPSAISIRLPVLAAGAATVWLFFLLMLRVSGRRAALIAGVLLATDATFLFTGCFDWGPVALQHLLLVGGVLLVVKFHQDGGNWALGLGFFLFGLGLWDKALFVWMLVGLGAATLAVFPKELFRHVTGRRLALAGLCFSVGAFPLIVHNLEASGDTVRANVRFSTENLSAKILALRGALNGSELLGYIPADDWMDNPRPPHTAVERFSKWLRDKAGERRTNLNLPAFLLALTITPLLWRTPARKPLLFSLVFLATTWLQMALTVGAGGAAHHIVLLWPFPLFAIAVAFAEASKRLNRVGTAVLVVAVTVMTCQNLLVYNHYLAQLIRNGGAGSFTDAIFPLAERMRQEYSSSEIYIIDWGMMDSLRLLDQGSLRLHSASFPLLEPEPGDFGRRVLRAEVSDPAHVFVTHAKAREEFKGVNDRLKTLALGAGYEWIALETVQDGNGRPVFEVFGFRRVF